MGYFFKSLCCTTKMWDDKHINLTGNHQLTVTIKTGFGIYGDFFRSMGKNPSWKLDIARRQVDLNKHSSLDIGWQCCILCAQSQTGTQTPKPKHPFAQSHFLNCRIGRITWRYSIPKQDIQVSNFQLKRWILSTASWKKPFPSIIYFQVYIAVPIVERTLCPVRPLRADLKKILCGTQKLLGGWNLGGQTISIASRSTFQFLRRINVFLDILDGSASP